MVIDKPNYIKILFNKKDIVMNKKSILSKIKFFIKRRIVTDKVKIEIKSRFLGDILFEYEKENNSLKETLEEAVKQGVDLRCADLERANLKSANLTGANLRYANLKGANLVCANLAGANLTGANLIDTNLTGANLIDANLKSANLASVNLIDANLGYANLADANLVCADLIGANLAGANLIDTNLGHANLKGANLTDTNLVGANNIPHIPLACPSDGEFIAWKKVDDKLVQLLIPADARRSSATANKCRCDKAKVVAITDIDGSRPVDSITCNTYVKTEYRVGEYVYPDLWDDNRWKECSHGIHFFINKQDAINYTIKQIN